MRSKAIGGFFDLELPSPKAPIYINTVNFQSARAAFLALLRAGQPRRVWMPYYTCRTMLASLQQADIPVVFYPIDQYFQIASDVALQDGDWLVYTNYFGLCTDYAASVAKRFGRDRVIVDASQSLFSAPFDCLATIYSPRKFLGVPDGGWLVSSLQVEEPMQVDEASYERALSLLKRAAFSPEVAYADHHQAEMTLFDREPEAMSVLTRRILASVDFQEVRRARNRNFAYLHECLGQHNLLPLRSADVDGPLCYPLIVEHRGLRDALIRERIFVPTYWRDVLELVPPTSTEAFLANGLIPLPCDQRYGEADMARVVDVCQGFLSSALSKDVMEIQV